MEVSLPIKVRVIKARPAIYLTGRKNERVKLRTMYWIVCNNYCFVGASN